jgi:hypothetical protein
MRRLPAAAVVAILAVLPAASQAPADGGAQGDIPVEEWTAMSAGRTLTYRIDGDLWAFEHYTPGTNRVQIELYDGTCMTGTWEYAAPHYCFHWEGQGTSCFRHTRRGDEILVIEASDGHDTPMTQTMTGVSDTPLACGAAGIS